MDSLSRRELFAGIAASAAVAQARTLPVIGVQLYTVRSILPDKAMETLSALEQIGYREVEAVGASLAQVWPGLQRTSMKPVSVHLDTALFTRDQAKLPAALEDAKRRGFAYRSFFAEPSIKKQADLRRCLQGRKGVGEIQ